MYIEVINPNQGFRDYLYDKYQNVDINDEENIDDIISDFLLLRDDDYELFSSLLKVMYQDFITLNISKREILKKFISFDELDEKIIDDPECLLTLLPCIFIFNNLDRLEKADVFRKSKVALDYLKDFNGFYVFDLLDYTREYYKEDLLLLFKESYEEAEYESIDPVVDDTDKTLFAQDKTVDFLLGLYDTNKDNYFKLCKEVVKDGYLYLKNESFNKKIKNYEKNYLRRYENGNLDKIIETIDDNDFFITDMVYYFNEYNKLDKDNQEKIKIKIKERGN